MNRKQLLLTKVAEESGEVLLEAIISMNHLSKLALKTQQFGTEEIMEGQPFTNAERMHSELDDLQAMIEMLNDEYGFGYEPNREHIETKKGKVNFYMAKSVELGQVKK